MFKGTIYKNNGRGLEQELGMLRVESSRKCQIRHLKNGLGWNSQQEELFVIAGIE